MTPWVVLYGHRPMYCTNMDPNCREFQARTRDLEPLLDKFGVDVAGEMMWGEIAVNMNMSSVGP